MADEVMVSSGDDPGWRAARQRVAEPPIDPPRVSVFRRRPNGTSGRVLSQYFDARGNPHGADCRVVLAQMSYAKEFQPILALPYRNPSLFQRGSACNQAYSIEVR